MAPTSPLVNSTVHIYPIERRMQSGCRRRNGPSPIAMQLFVDATGRTSRAGVWAAGNVVDPRVQVITSAGAGSAAAIAINAELVRDDVERAAEADHVAR